MKKLVLLDLDNTLFRSTELRVEFYKKIAKLLKSKIESEDHIVELCNIVGKDIVVGLGYFSPDTFVHKLSKKIDIRGKEKQVKDIILDTEFSKDFMHTEVYEVLTQLSKTCELAIFSQGEEEFQKSKLHSILEFFPKDSIHFEKDKKQELERIFGKYKDFLIYYVDDRVHILEYSKKINPAVFTVWIKRGPFAEKEMSQNFEPDAIIARLSELIPLIKQ